MADYAPGLASDGIPGVLLHRYDDGSSVTVKRRERPQVLSIGGKPALLFTGVQGDAPNSFTHVQEIEIG
eukprot:COSAG04_NODE_9737_length_836_cov_0.838535_1_plen_69_part_00